MFFSVSFSRLQCLLLTASADEQIAHLIDESLVPYPVRFCSTPTTLSLVIIMHADLHHLNHLEEIIAGFSSTAGLCINFNKSTFILILDLEFAGTRLSSMQI